MKKTIVYYYAMIKVTFQDYNTYKCRRYLNLFLEKAEGNKKIEVKYEFEVLHSELEDKANTFFIDLVSMAKEDIVLHKYLMDSDRTLLNNIINNKLIPSELYYLYIKIKDLDNKVNNC